MTNEEVLTAVSRAAQESGVRAIVLGAERNDIRLFTFDVTVSQGDGAPLTFTVEHGAGNSPDSLREQIAPVMPKHS